MPTKRHIWYTLYEWELKALSEIIDGGITGIAIILSHLTGIRLGIFLFALNLPFLLVGYQQIGRTFAVSTFYSIRYCR